MRVAGVGVPPPSETADRTPYTEGAKTMVPVRPQLPPRASIASQIASTRPSARDTLCSLPFAKKATRRLSGAQNG